MPLFERDVLVRIGVENLTEEIDVRDLRVLFDINKSLDKKKTNTAQIQIYNLKETHRKKINQIDNVIGLEAGYKDENNRALIFKGNITDVSFDATGGDHITTINAGDGDKAFKEVKFTKSYVAGTSAEQIFNDVINQFGLPKKLTERIKEQLTKKGSQYANAFSAAGRAKDILNKITGKLGYEWSIQDTNLKVIEKDGVDDSLAVFLSKDTGLIGSPKRINAILDKTKKEQKKTGWEFISLLQAGFECGGKVSVTSREIPNRTEFKIESIRHTGDTNGMSFNTILETSDLAVPTGAS